MAPYVMSSIQEEGIPRTREERGQRSEDGHVLIAELRRGRSARGQVALGREEAAHDSDGQ